MDVGITIWLAFTFALFIGLLLLGLPYVFSTGAAGLVGYTLVFGPKAWSSVVFNTWEYMNSYLLIAIPMFLFMAELFHRTGIADQMFEAPYRWLAAMPGSLAAASVVWCAIFGAMSGSGIAAIGALSVMALPAMMKRGYSTEISLGSILAGAPLGLIIPPSIVMVFYGLITGVSIGKLYMAGILPGIMIAVLMCIYIVVRCWRNPAMGPALPPGERFTWKEKFVSLRGLIVPAGIIFLMLGTIYLGVATPTEASAVGCSGTLLYALAARKTSWKILKDSVVSTSKVMAMMMWLTFGGVTFGTFVTSSGLMAAVTTYAVAVDVDRWFVLIAMQVVVLIAGMFLDPFVFIILFGPAFNTIATGLGFDPIWLGLLITVNVSISYISPPFGWSLFVMKSFVPKNINMSHLIRASYPFVIVQAVGMAIIMVFPQIALWLPSLMSK